TKRALCIVPYFPPTAVSGTHRIRAVVRHLPAYGWQPVVIAPQPDPKLAQDLGLLEGLPSDLVIYRTPAPNLLQKCSSIWTAARRLLHPLRSQSEETVLAANGSSPVREPARGWADWASWWLQIPHHAIGWLPCGVLTAYHAMRRHRCRAIYTSGPFWTTHLIGLVVKRLTRKAWVASFRDPWRANPFRKIPYKSLDHYDAWLEQHVVHEADWVVANTDPACEEFKNR